MRKRIIIGLSALLLATGCVLPVDIEVNTDGIGSEGIRGSGHAATVTRSIQGFHGIEASGVGRVIIERTGQERVSLTADDNLLDYFETEVRGGTLYLGPRPGVSLNPAVQPVFRVKVARLDRIGGSGAVAFEAHLGAQAELHVLLSGVCSAGVHGSVDRLVLVLSGVTSFAGLNLIARAASVVASGVSWAEVHVTQRLEAHASGNAGIRYRGGPEEVIIQTSGLGSVEPY